MTLKRTLSALLAAGLAMATDARADITVFTTDFIATADRTNFTSFESMPLTSAAPATYSDNGISVQQWNNSKANPIATNGPWIGEDGARSWYPNGGDNGFTEIKRSDGSSFYNMGLITAAAVGSPILHYRLTSGGVSVKEGTLAIDDWGQGATYIGFGGGGFDAVDLRAGTSAAGAFLDGSKNYLLVDAIELSDAAAQVDVPEPGSVALLGIGLTGGLALAGRRRRGTRETKAQ